MNVVVFVCSPTLRTAVLGGLGFAAVQESELKQVRSYGDLNSTLRASPSNLLIMDFDRERLSGCSYWEQSDREPQSTVIVSENATLAEAQAVRDAGGRLIRLPMRNDALGHIFKQLLNTN